MKPTDKPHTDSLTLEALWRKGYPVQIIANRIGRSRSAVIGKAKRLGLPPHAGASNPKFHAKVSLP